MLDPFPNPFPALAALTTPLATATSLETLPLHSHEILLSFVFYHLIDQLVSPAVSSWLFPNTFPKFNKRTRRNWNMHFTSLVQSCLICGASGWVIMFDEERSVMSWEERVWGYTGAIGLVQALSCGYFLWDVQISTIDFKIFGPSSLIHAISALLVTSIGFRPFANYYGISFTLYELSTPLLNFHWFLDKLNLTGSRAQYYNGMALLATFFLCRVVWGNYQSYWIYQDVWKAYHSSGTVGTHIGGKGSVSGQLEVMRFAGEQTLPKWLAVTYLASNTVLSLLNVFWFSQMINAVKKRFTPKKEKKAMESAGGVDKKIL